MAYPHHQVISVSGSGLPILLGELVTAHMHNLPVTVVVFNNSALGMVKLGMLVNGLPDFGTDVHDINYAGVAATMGFHAERANDPKKVRRAPELALKADGPALAQLPTDPNALSLPPEITGEQMIGFWFWATLGELEPLPDAANVPPPEHPHLHQDR